MKKHINTYLSIILALSMLLSMLPIYAAATDDEFEGLEIVEEIPFEFELEPGDLPLDELANAVLPAADLPSYISASLAEERAHVNRLYLQEPDANTVMFQNRDGSKTIYVFSKPVKDTGITLGTNALAVNGGKIAFSGNNIITNRIGLNAVGKQIQDYKIGYSDIQTLPGGVLTANGIDITEDVRNWALSEFGANDAEYNISESASAAYTASVSVIETELTSNAGASVSANAVTPGITITPIDPSPATGATVMAITYSDLAGKMCFKNQQTNAYLTLHPTNRNSLVTTANIYGTFSYWIVEYVGTNKYTICSYYDRENKYLGVDYDNYELILGCMDDLAETAYFDITITSYNNSTIEIKPYYESNYAISSNCGLVQGDESDEFPDSCSWIITNRSDFILVRTISPQAMTRIEQAGVDFYPEYTTVPSNPSESDIRLYYANTNQEVTYGDYDDSMEANPYYITTPGIYTVYYKDTVTGVRSANFTLVIVEITLSDAVRFEEKGTGFNAIYTVTPNTYVGDIKLFYAETNSQVGTTTDGKYIVNASGEYAVYYKDTISGAKSAEFKLVIYALPTFEDNFTYSIQPIGYQSSYLTMNVSNGGNTSLSVGQYNATLQGTNYQNTYESWENLSRAFRIISTPNEDYQYSITSILTKSQYEYPSESHVKKTSYTGSDYTLTTIDSVDNTINIVSDESNDDSYTIIMSTTPGTGLTIVCIEDYYVIFATLTDENDIFNNQALKYVPNDEGGTVVVDEYQYEDINFRWDIKQFGVNAPLIMQTQQYTCGPATFLQVLYGKGLGVSVPDVNGNETDCLHEKMMRLITRLPYQDNQDGTYGTLEGFFADYINYYYFNNNKVSQCYKQWEKSDTGNDNLQDLSDMITGSLSEGWAPFVWTNSGGTPYKQAAGGAHYICIIGYEEHTINNITEQYVIIANCHYDNDILGIYAIPLDELYQKIGLLYYYSA